MTRTLLLAATALALSSAVALAQNGPVTPGYSNDGVSAPAKAKQAVRHEKAAAKPLYDYAPTHLSSYGSTPIMFGVAF
jgi:hypothetical protein